MEEARHRVADRVSEGYDFLLSMDEEAKKDRPPESCLWVVLYSAYIHVHINHVVLQNIYL